MAGLFDAHVARCMARQGMETPWLPPREVRDAWVVIRARIEDGELIDDVVGMG